MIQVYTSKHLSREKQIQLGSYYTPRILVQKVFEFIQPHISVHKNRAVIFDNAAGCGAFIFEVKDCDYRAADNDPMACDFLKTKLDQSRVYFSNSLQNVSRGKYNISDDSFLIQIGNPPYNDTTSEFRNGQKGKNESDKDLFDRDLGISFLKSYNKLRADVVCILHPLSYLIKEANFKRLKEFKDNYRLAQALVFPSSMFEGTGSAFPVIIGLYIRDPSGMSFDYIKSFNFKVLNNERDFRPRDYETTDGHINKYPPRKKETKVSPIGLYYYSFRDFNSLRRNASFFSQPRPNGIVVTLDNFYKYAYLHAMKHLFVPKDSWLYGNLSPLLDAEMLETNKRLFVEYAIVSSPVVKKQEVAILKQIAEHYQIDINTLPDKGALELDILDNFSKLV